MKREAGIALRDRRALTTLSVLLVGALVVGACGGKTQLPDGSAGDVGVSRSGSYGVGGSAVSLGGRNSFGGSVNGGFGVAGDSNGARGSFAGGSSAGGSGAGGSVGVAGSTNAAGAGGVVIVPPVRTDKVDLLLMIDNSVSMADKQEVLANSVPMLVERLVSPNCVDALGNASGLSVDANGVCPNALHAEFGRVRDLHVGIVSSSLGGHNGDVCNEPSSDDHGQLLGALRPDTSYTTWNGSGFLAWDPDARDTPPGENDVQTLVANFKNMVTSAGEGGCGFESQLEAWYRFLIDPDPPTSIALDSGVNTPLFPDRSQNPVLAQRAQFLRDDSLVVILMLTDENDCSLQDSGQSWVVGVDSQRLPRARSACANDPNDPCCLSCAATDVPLGCVPPAQDPQCELGNYDDATDSTNLRCYDQKRRFGFDFLQPLDRYVGGLTAASVPGRRAAAFEPNPLFSAGKRSPSMVFLAGLVGVPWQDLADVSSVATDTSSLRYLSYRELVAQGRWPMMLSSSGDATTLSNPPGDKLMFETPLDRTTLFGAAPHPILGALAALAPAASTGLPNAINGHEVNIFANDDLQFACIFPLATPRACDGTSAACDCTATRPSVESPLCDGSTQRYAKAYPSVRELSVLERFGALTNNAVTGSICPKAPSGSVADPAVGYNPFMSALVESMKPALLLP